MTRSPAGTRIVAEMSDETQLTIRLDRRGGPIGGLVVTDDQQHEFRGWIELASLIESLRRSAEGSPESPSSNLDLDLSPPSPGPSGIPGGPPAS